MEIPTIDTHPNLFVELRFVGPKLQYRYVMGWAMGVGPTWSLWIDVPVFPEGAA